MLIRASHPCPGSLSYCMTDCSLGTKLYYSITQVPSVWPLSQYKRPSELHTQARLTVATISRTGEGTHYYMQYRGCANIKPKGCDFAKINARAEEKGYVFWTKMQVNRERV